MSMNITIAIVTYNAERCIERCIDSVMQQDYQGGLYEVLVVDGCSDDRTLKILKNYGDRIRLYQNPGRTISSNRNVALKEAKYQYIAFTDSDCVVERNWLEKLSAGIKFLISKDSSVVGVGGGNIVSCESHFHSALAVAQDSFIGSLGSIQGKTYDCIKKVNSLSCLNVIYKCDVLRSLHGFDVRLNNMCEDADVNYRLGEHGYSLYYIPDANVIHCPRQNLVDWSRSMYAYGIGRAIIMLKHRTLFSPVYLLPVLFFPFMLSCALFGIIWKSLWLAIIYFPLVFVLSLLLTLKAKKKDWFMTGIVLCCTHICYSIGIWAGFLTKFCKKYT